MIERLRDEQAFATRDEAEAARLLRTLNPVVPPESVERRVYANLGVRRRSGPTMMRIASAASVPLLIAILVGAAMAMYLHHGAGTPRAGVRTSMVAATGPSHAIAEPGTRELAPASDEPVARELSRVETSSTPPFAERQETRTTPAPDPSPAPVASRRSKGHDVARSAGVPAQAEAPATAAQGVESTPVESTETRVAAAPPEEAALVLAGLRALRREHDPAQAGVLLARYLERFPQGTLTQEALAIAIEAGLARGDRVAAAGLAEQYLKRFPAGRFVRLARKAANPPRP